jgi:hypothetical protein
LLAHVRNQLPYALSIGAISVVFRTLPAGFGVNPWICCGLCPVASFAVLRYFGKTEVPA